ncbi:MAG: hypothetical protein AAGF58_09365, partial [Pseudomonadota bacterium]
MTIQTRLLVVVVILALPMIALAGWTIATVFDDRSQIQSEQRALGPMGSLWSTLHPVSGTPSL